ncbi:MAG: hypothetical protein ACYTEQ_12370 [Planctomycetota bacterium]|jgi:hypothetical protein
MSRSELEKHLIVGKQIADSPMDMTSTEIEAGTLRYRVAREDMYGLYNDRFEAECFVLYVWLRTTCTKVRLYSKINISRGENYSLIRQVAHLVFEGSFGEAIAVLDKNLKRTHIAVTEEPVNEVASWWVPESHEVCAVAEETLLILPKEDR